MKLTPQESERLKRLLPSKFSAEGFLGDDPRPLEEIVAEDLRTLDALGVPLDALAVALRRALIKAREGLGAGVEVAPGAVAEYFESRGRIPSPFKGEGVFEKGEAVVTRTASEERFRLTDLGVHLIERHAFFQGRGAPYRVEPETAARVLGLTARAGGTP